jgi:hypothetical protein
MATYHIRHLFALWTLKFNNAVRCWGECYVAAPVSIGAGMKNIDAAITARRNKNVALWFNVASIQSMATTFYVQPRIAGAPRCQ